MKNNTVILYFIVQCATIQSGDFSVATINVLHQQPYEKHVTDAFKRMKLSDRVQAFKKHMPKGVDVVCMQEWFYNKEAYSSKQFLSALYSVYPNDRYEFVEASFGIFNAIHGPCIVFNKNKFKM